MPGQNLTYSIVQELGASVVSGVYSSDDKFPIEADLCNQFGASRSVLREAYGPTRLQSNQSVSEINCRSRASIVQPHHLRHPAQVGKTAHVRAEPVLKPLGPVRLGIGIVRRARHGHEDACFTHRPGRGVDDTDPHAGVIHKQLLTGPMGLAHDQVQLAGPGSVLLAEPGVLIALRMSPAILMPQQL